jgi:uncharacterized protein YndB with AHSA1/START domain
MAQTAAAKPASSERPSLTLTRRFRARPEKVWAAWTDPEKLIAWFCTAKAKPGSFRAKLDVRVGGSYRISFDMAESGEYSEVGGVYREVVPNERLVFTWAWHSTPERESLVVLTMAEDGDGTMFTLHHEQFFDEKARDDHRRGWTLALDNLEKVFP